MAVQRFHDEGSELILDDALAPILVTVWYGPATVELVREFKAWVGTQLDLARERGQVCALISDNSESGRPSANARREFTQFDFDMSQVAGTYAIIDSPMVRGAMTAISWVLGDRFQVTSSPSLARALVDAATLLRERGHMVDEAAVQAYRRPEATTQRLAR